MAAVHDFWRRRVASDSCPPELAANLLERKDTPEKYAKLLRRSLAKPLAKNLWPAGIDAPAAHRHDAASTTAYEAARGLWATQREAIVATRHGDRSRHSTKARTRSERSTVPPVVGTPISTKPRRSPRSTPTAKPDLLSGSRLTQRTNKNRMPPTHPFFDAADALLAARAAITERARSSPACA